MFAFSEFIVNLYIKTPLSVRFCYAIWVLFIGLYLYSSLYEKYNNIKLERKIEERNWPFTLYILGAIALVIYYLSGNGDDNFIPLFDWKHGAISINIGFVLMVIGLVVKHGAISINIGFVLMVIGLVVVSFARVAIDGYWGPDIYKYNKNERKLITSGIYSLVRNPIYLGQNLMALGTVFMANQWIIIFFPICLAIVNHRRAQKEEKELQNFFGQEYTDYKKKVSYIFPT
jgi:protein-S-isoprenylcysteine O-methyltransferase Ste14